MNWYLGYIRNADSSEVKAKDQNGGLGHLTKGDAGEASEQHENLTDIVNHQRNAN